MQDTDLKVAITDTFKKLDPTSHRTLAAELRGNVILTLGRRGFCLLVNHGGDSLGGCCNSDPKGGRLQREGRYTQS